MNKRQYIAICEYLNKRERLSRLQLLNDATISDSQLEERIQLTKQVGNNRYVKAIGGTLHDYSAIMALSVIGRDNVKNTLAR